MNDTKERYRLAVIGDAKWDVLNSTGRVCGQLQRLETGYLARNTEAGNVVKRFRLIDALRDAFGDQNDYETAE